MASTTDFGELIADPDFQALAAQIFDVVVNGQGNDGSSAHVTCDALMFISAIILEASPHYGDQDGLEQAQEDMSADAKSMLQLVRALSIRKGRHLLYAMTESQSLN